jgi:hypothetical protein
MGREEVRVGCAQDAYARRTIVRAYLDERRRPWRRERRVALLVWPVRRGSGSQTARAMVSVRSTWIRLHDRLLTACTTRRRVAATCAHSIMKIGLFLREA